MHSNHHDIIAMGAIHKQRQQLGGGKGSKIGQNCRRIVLKYCRYGGRGVKYSETLPTLFMDGPFPHLPLLRLGYLPKWVKITPLTRTRVLQQLVYDQNQVSVSRTETKVQFRYLYWSRNFFSETMFFLKINPDFKK